MDKELYDFSDIPHEETFGEKIVTILFTLGLCAVVGLLVGVVIALAVINPMMQV